MDQEGTDREALLENIRNHFGEGCIDFNGLEREELSEQIADPENLSGDFYKLRMKVKITENCR